ncbi:MAG: amidohydrolase family protein, partial [Acidobacteriota bacterium]
QTLGLDEVEAVVRLILGGASFAELHLSEDDIITFLQQPYVAGSTDGTIPEYGHGRAHPRSYGAFIRRLARYVVHLGAVKMPFAIHTATGLAAEIIGIKDRGYLQPGQWADIVVFDPRMLRDRATYNNPHQYSQGILWVLVNGEVVIEEGKPNGRLAGRVLLKN